MSPLACRVGRWGARACLAAALAALAAGQITRRQSVGPGGTQADGGSYAPSFSADLRYLAFHSRAGNLVGGDTNGAPDVFVRDRHTGAIERVSVATGGAQGDRGSFYPSMSADGRYVAFTGYATNLVGGDTNNDYDIFVRDRQLGTTELVSVGTTSGEPNGNSYGAPSISADGRYVAFMSSARFLVPGDENLAPDVFVRDRQAATTRRVSVATGGGEGNGPSGYCSISANGRYVVFRSQASNLVPADTNGVSDVFVHDLQTGTTERASVSSTGVQGNGSAYSPSTPGISADGGCVVFVSYASNLVFGDSNVRADVFVRDRQNGTTHLVSYDSAGVQGNADSSATPSISANGRYVAFAHNAANLVPGDTNGVSDIFVRDWWSGTTERVSVASSGAQGNGSSGYFGLSISADGRYVAFASDAKNLVAGDTNDASDVFLRERF